LVGKKNFDKKPAPIDMIM